MPNHFHGIIVIGVGADLRVGPHATRQGTHVGVPLPTVVQWFKTMTTNEYVRGIKRLRWVPFQGRLWQRNYYEHILRDEESLERVRQYITDNPARWTSDRENPWATAPDRVNP